MGRNPVGTWTSLRCATSVTSDDLLLLFIAIVVLGIYSIRITDRAADPTELERTASKRHRILHLLARALRLGGFALFPGSLLIRGSPARPWVLVASAAILLLSATLHVALLRIGLRYVSKDTKVR